MDEANNGKLFGEGMRWLPENADFQKDLWGGDAELYSATKQQAAVKKTVKKNQKAEQWKTENPLILRDDVYDV